jgi:lipopolysaccharide export LptBFGC system permease protein LptF
MTILDRHIAARFFANFILLFAILFVFAASIDIILELDAYTGAARAAAFSADAAGIDAGEAGPPWWAVAFRFAHAVVDFHGPRIAQFFAYMLGVVTVGAAGFTIAQLHRNRELVAIMAAGTSLVRVALVIIACATGLNILQLVNQEVLLPRLAPLLVRTHGSILQGGLDEFPVPLTRDARSRIVRFQSLDPRTESGRGFLLIERDGKGAAVARVEARSAVWNADLGGYDLVDGVRSTGRTVDDDGAVVVEGSAVAVPFAATDLSPRALTIRRYSQYAQMLSLAQLREMREDGGVDPDLLSRLTYLRLGGIFVNLLVLAACVPYFLLREPANLLRQSILCALFAVPGTLGSLVAMTIDVPGLAPAVSVFLPAAILLPIAAGRLGMMKT